MAAFTTEVLTRTCVEVEPIAGLTEWTVEEREHIGLRKPDRAARRSGS
ncbi:MAG: hypothetical protein MUP21_01330 [Dehalococcoidia bacterium]|nr:hypothetical protein [Dehalococcoidia bacterium]